MEEIKKFIVPKIKSNDKIYIRNGPYLESITDYSFDGTNVHNRQYLVHIDLGIDISVLPDVTSNLKLWIEITYDKKAKVVNAILNSWWVHTNVPWLLNGVKCL